MSDRPGVRIADTAVVHPDAVIGPGSQVWNHTQIREGARLGRDCILGKDVYVDFDVSIGDRCKVQNGAQIFHGAELEDGVFVGPGVILTNDRVPRAITPEGGLKSADDWTVGRTLIRLGASLGAGSTIVTSVTIGRFAMIGAGAVVTIDVPDHALVVGVPARQIGWVCACGERLHQEVDTESRLDDSIAKPSTVVLWRCEACGRRYRSPGQVSSGLVEAPVAHR